MAEDEDFASRLNDIEQKWQGRWEEEELFQVDPNDENKFYITVAYPYPSGGMHLGHVGTYTLPDVFARFKRMQGHNVLFPMAWHVTGTPIIGALNRVKEGDEDQIQVLRDVYNVPEDEMDSWEEPMDFAEYFIENSYKPNMKKLGFSVDWRREFTTSDNQYNRFIEWQYKRLRDKGLVKKGKHPTKYCLNDQNPVTTHDLLEGEDAEKQDYSLVKFEGDDYVFPTATLRPETVFGVTHMLINPEADYLKAEVDGEKWVVSEEAAEKLRYQGHEVKELADAKGEEFIGQKVKNPVTGEHVIMLPATFVDPDSGSGVVMSVPAHAPYDWISLKDLKEDEEMLQEYGIRPRDVKNIEPKTIINVDGYGEVPAKEACDEYGVKSQDDEEALEKATQDVYEKEFHTGTMNASCGEFAGQKVNAIKDSLIESFEEQGAFSSMYDFSEEVVCRCGGKVIVSLQDSWFLEYGDRGWKDRAQKNLDRMDIIPPEKREDYNHTIDWLESWPAIRNFGLGTKMPFDDDFIVEPLSDSTIYMAFYTIRHIIEDVDAEKLEPEFFDYVFNGKGSAEKVASSTGISQDTIEEAHESFDYWYPLDWRTSAFDLIQNHLTFMVFHHTALFDEQKWPQGIATWGMGLLEGKKMSSSKGHVKLPDEAIQEYGADTTRFFIFASREPWQDWDWRGDQVEQYREKIKAFHDRSLELHGTGEKRENTTLDRYALSRLQEIIQETTDGLEEFQTRKAGLNAFFELNSLINKYRQRSETLNTEVVNALVETQVKLMSPFTPHICEELWDELGGEGFVAEADWPEADEGLRDKEIERAYQVVDNTIEDIRELEDIVGDYEEIRIILADDWKRGLFRELSEVVEERPEFGEAMGRLVEGRKEHSDMIKDLLQKYLEDPGDLPAVLDQEEEKEMLKENHNFLEQEFNAWVKVESEKESEEEKASRAEPGRPAIVMN
ncbi:MAG: leucine--tRNA ligase [Candidatus Nanohaloarchaea archaeon]